MANDPHADPVATLARLIRDIRFCMLTTRDLDGKLHSRPMATQQAPFDGWLWFFTGRATHKAEEIAAEPAVNCSYADPQHQRYISVSGTAQVVQDPEMMERLWSPAYKAWFPRGLEDPDLALLRVDVEHAEYWDAPHGAVVKLIGFLTSAVTGERVEMGKHERLELP